MIDTYNEMIDMQISHSQLHIYSGDYIESNAQWGKGNIDQGAIIHDSHLVFDPIIQEPFKAKIYIKLNEKYKKILTACEAFQAIYKFKIIPFTSSQYPALKSSQQNLKMEITMFILKSAKAKRLMNSFL